MARELEQAMAKNLGAEKSSDALMQAMARLLILLLQEFDEFKPEGDLLVEELKNRILNKYPKRTSLANQLIPSPS